MHLELKIDILGENMCTSHHQVSSLPLLFIHYLREIQRMRKKGSGWQEEGNRMTAEDDKNRAETRMESSTGRTWPPARHSLY